MKCVPSSLKKLKNCVECGPLQVFQRSIHSPQQPETGWKARKGIRWRTSDVIPDDETLCARADQMTAAVLQYNARGLWSFM